MNNTTNIEKQKIEAMEWAKNLSWEEVKENLITDDYRGKIYKEAAIERLIGLAQPQ